MTSQVTATRDEWLSARVRLIDEEKELTRHSDAPWWRRHDEC